MQITTFRAKSIQEALELVRDKLGPDAHVRGTREVRSLVGRRLIEVEAVSTSLDTAAPLRLSQTSSEGKAGEVRQSYLDTTVGYEENSIASPLLASDRQADAIKSVEQSQHNSDLAGSAAVYKSNLKLNVSDESLPMEQWPSLAALEVWRELLNTGVEVSLAAGLLRKAIQSCAPEYRNDAWMIRGRVNHLVVQRLKVAQSKKDDTPDHQRIIALVGPSGAGKTTLLGKIAARAYREHSLQIGVVTLDTWHDVAVDQLLDFVKLVEAQLEIVDSIEQLAPALQRLREFDLVLIDTAGRAPDDSAQMSKLQELLQTAQPDEIHLVLGCDAASSCSKLAIERFREVGATHLCISKLDQAGSLGQWLNPLSNSSIPVMYLTHGKDIEKDLLSANVRHLASILIGQASLTTRT